MSDEEEDLDDNPVSTEDLQPLSEEPDFVPAPEICLGYRFVGDNVDKNIKPSYQRHEHRGQSLHHFHSYAVKDRTVISSYSDATAFLTHRSFSLLLKMLSVSRKK